jgi:hypothetical protein
MHRSKLFAFDFGRPTRSDIFKLSTIIAVVLFTLGIGPHPLATANIIISTPAGLVPGDTFRIAFVTDAPTQATSSSISTYNTFVNTDAIAQAGGGFVTYNGTPLTFSAIASTSGENADTNIGSTGASVYTANGLLIAHSDLPILGGLWSQHLLHAIDLNLNAVNIGGSFVWTGTGPFGEGDSSIALGTPDPEFGFSTDGVTNFRWVFAGNGEDPLNMFPLYGISQPLTVPTPEPPSIVLAMLAGCAAVAAYVRCQKAATRGH